MAGLLRQYFRGFRAATSQNLAIDRRLGDCSILLLCKDSLLHANPTVPPWLAESQQIFPSPAAQRFLINWRRRCVFARQVTLVPATPGWGVCKSRNSTGMTSWVFWTGEPGWLSEHLY